MVSLGLWSIIWTRVPESQNSAANTMDSLVLWSLFGPENQRTKAKRLVSKKLCSFQYSAHCQKCRLKYPLTSAPPFTPRELNRVVIVRKTNSF